MSMMRVCIFLIFPLLIASVLWAESDEGQAGFMRQVMDGDESWMVSNPHSHSLSDMHRFSLFKGKFNISYVSKEEEHFRFQIFRSNLKQAARNQKLDPTAVHGVTQFSDLTEDEFRKKFLGLGGFELPIDTVKGPYLPIDNLPDTFDWRDKNAVTSVKSQGECGSCWSFSTIGVLEGAHFLATKKLVELSPQQLVDCDKGNIGCSGGLMTKALEYVIKVGGVMSEKDYPYTAQKGQCKFNSTKIEATIASYSTVPQDPFQYAANIVRNGPISVGLNGAGLQSYVSGVTCPSYCGYYSGHAVLLVGYGEETKGGYIHWIAKNTWGTDWGEEGYFRICAGHDACAIESSMAVTVSAAGLNSHVSY